MAGGITSLGFIPQLIKGYQTKKLDDISYLMPIVLAFGMLLWLIYGIFLSDLPIIAANIFGIGCNITLVVMKKYYRTSPAGHNI
jgi:MtN3 and saliva related transmembrane protein